MRISQLHYHFIQKISKKSNNQNLQSSFPLPIKSLKFSNNLNMNLEHQESSL